MSTTQQHQNGALSLLTRRYLLHSIIGEGGMGRVFRATDRLTGRGVALKQVTVPHNEITGSLGKLENTMVLAQEFRILSSLRHPHIIEVHDYGFDSNGSPFYTMDYLENSQHISTASAGRDAVGVLRLMRQFLFALDYLHRCGILHRDLKPSNVLVVGDDLRVLDFGLAIERQQATGVVGTISYIAPETFENRPPTEASDLYAFGLLLFECLSGHYPMTKAETLGDFIRIVLQEEPKWEHLAHIELPKAPLRDLLAALLDKKPENRPQSAAATLALLEKLFPSPPPPQTKALRESYLQAARFVGREEESAFLEALLRRAEKHEGAACVVVGESGVGKSRLLDEIRIRALVRGVASIRGHAVAEGTSLFRTLRDVLQHMVLAVDIDEDEASILAPIVPDIERLTGLQTYKLPQSDPREVRDRLQNTIVNIFSRVPTALLLIVEDLQWADEGTIDVIEALAARLEHLPILLLASLRQDEYTPRLNALPLQRLDLIRLGTADIKHLSAAILGEQAAQRASLIDFLQEQTEGNVFFIIEVLRDLAERAGDLDAIEQVSLPRSVLSGGMESLLARRVGQIPPQQRPLHNLAAIAGRKLDLVLLERLADGVDLEKWLDTGVMLAVFDHADGAWRYAHDKLREHLIAAMPAEDLRRGHATVAAAIEATYPDDDATYTALYFHYRMAEDLPKAAHFGKLAGLLALGNFARDDAISILSAVRDTQAEIAAPAIERGEVLMYLGEAYYLNYDYQNAQNTFSAAAALTGAKRPKRLFWPIILQLLIHLYKTVVPFRWRKARTDPHLLAIRARCCGRSGISLFLMGKLWLSLYDALQALNAADADHPLLYQEYIRRFSLMPFPVGALGLQKLASAYAHKGLSGRVEQANALNEVLLLETAAIPALHDGRLDEALNLIIRARDAAVQSHAYRQIEESQAYYVDIVFRRGHFEEVHALLNELSSNIAGKRSAIMNLTLKGYAATLAMIEARHADALRHGHEAANFWHESDNYYGNATTRIQIYRAGILASAHAFAGHYEEADAHALPALDLLPAFQVLWFPDVDIMQFFGTYFLFRYQGPHEAEIHSLFAAFLRRTFWISRRFPYFKANYHLYRGVFVGQQGKSRAALGHFATARRLALPCRLHYIAAQAAYFAWRFCPDNDPAKQKHHQSALKDMQALGATYYLRHLGGGIKQ